MMLQQETIHDQPIAISCASAVITAFTIHIRSLWQLAGGVSTNQINLQAINDANCYWQEPTSPCVTHHHQHS